MVGKLLTTDRIGWIKEELQENVMTIQGDIKESKYGQELSVHHIIPFCLVDDYLIANKLTNLVSVCEPCHRIIHSGDNHPSKFKQAIKSVDDIV